MDPALQREIEAVNKFRAINEAIVLGDSTVQRFYEGCTVLITGGSGFLGKQLLEKLFRSCEMKKIYILLREKKKKAISERLETMLEDPAFDSVRKTKPDFAKKLVPIEGDISELKLGLSDEDWNMLTDEVEVIIHAAATVHFDEPLKMATLINVRGTREMLVLGKACTKLKSYVHVSTAYSHAVRSRINQDVLEQFYQSPVPPQTMIEMVETVDEDRLNDITPQLIQGWPNTYAFTKAIAEEAVRSLSGDMPICIVRPAIVIASYREPSPGWLDMSCAFNGPTGFIIGGGLGIVHALLSANNINVGLVPVDLVNNAIISAGWATADRRAKGLTDVKIYTVTNNRNHVYMKYITDVLINEVEVKYPTPLAVWYVFMIFTQNRYLFSLLNWLWQVIPAYIADAVCAVLGKPRKFVKLLTKAIKRNEVLSYFTCNQWEFYDKNLCELQSSLTKTDQIIFNSDISVLDWKEYITIWSLGVRRYIIKDNLQGTDIAFRKQYWFRIFHYIIASIYIYVLYKIFYMFLWTVATVVGFVFVNIISLETFCSCMQS